MLSVDLPSYRELTARGRDNIPFRVKLGFPNKITVHPQSSPKWFFVFVFFFAPSARFLFLQDVLLTLSLREQEVPQWMEGQSKVPVHEAMPAACPLWRIIHAASLLSDMEASWSAVNPSLTTALKDGYCPFLTRGLQSNTRKQSALRSPPSEGSWLEHDRLHSGSVPNIEREHKHILFNRSIEMSSVKDQPPLPKEKVGKKTSQTWINSSHKDMWFGTVKEYRFIFRKIASN